MTSDPNQTQVDEILEGYYRWCMETVASSLKIEPILGTGEATPLAPSEAKAAIQALLVKERIDELEKVGQFVDSAGNQALLAYLDSHLATLNQYLKERK